MVKLEQVQGERQIANKSAVTEHKRPWTIWQFQNVLFEKFDQLISIRVKVSCDNYIIRKSVRLQKGVRRSTRRGNFTVIIMAGKKYR